MGQEKNCPRLGCITSASQRASEGSKRVSELALVSQQWSSKQCIGIKGKEVHQTHWKDILGKKFPKQPGKDSEGNPK